MRRDKKHRSYVVPLAVAVWLLALGIVAYLNTHPPTDNTGGRSSAEDIASCKRALSTRWEALWTTGVVPSTDRPIECQGLTDTELAQIGHELTGQ